MKTIRVMTLQGTFFDIKFEESVDISVQITRWRADGYIGMGSVFIPMHAVSYIVELQNGSQPSLVEGMTKQ